ncbi:MAG: molybdopterin-binding xanthine dehydrogenase [Ignavibacteria bacterium]|nr:molybdopterin-binding xanthine dehydrogenase [Ignavibacteria bacterium]
MKENNNNSTNFARREFILGISATSAGVLIGLVNPFSGTAKLFAGDEKKFLEFIPNIWLEVKKDNTIVVTCSYSELGQGARTTTPIIIADEMDAEWEMVKVVQALADTKYDSQSTAGSTSGRSSLNTLRQAGATARTMLITAAAQTWGIAESACKAQLGYIIETAGSRKLSFGELVDKAATLPVPNANQVKQKDPKDFIYMTKGKHPIDTADIITGKAKYGIDAIVPGMKYAAVAMPPAIGASVSTYDDTQTKAIPGVIKTIKFSNYIAVIADNTYAAFMGVEALKVNWNMGSNANLNSAQITKSLTDKIGTLPSLPTNTAKTIEAQYSVPYLAHAPMEPMNCTVHLQGSKCEVWVSTQNSQGVQSTVASAVGLSSANVIVHTNLSGGAFGRRNGTDDAQKAAQVAKQAGVPIQLVYSRKDDIRNGYYRPASIHALKAGLDASGKITGWIHKGVFAGSPGVSSPSYSIPNIQNLNDSGITVIPTGAWRSVSASQVVFANESFIDELAIAAGIDPLDFRLSIAGTRIKTVLNELKLRSDWTKPLPKGSGRGVAVFSGWSGYAGHVVEVTIDSAGKIKVDRVIAVCDVGFAINPIAIESQMMGNVIDGLSTALIAEITIDKGIAVQSGYSSYKWLRIGDSPKMEIYILQSGGFTSGVGELGFPTVSPALCNAIYNACGIRVRSLPISHTPLVTDVEDKENFSNELSLYPNPFTDELNIRIGSDDGSPTFLNIEIHDILGSTVFQRSFAGNLSGGIIHKLNLNELASGVYFVNLSAGNKIFKGRAIKK